MNKRDELERLAELARKATQGEWSLEQRRAGTFTLFAGRSDQLHGLNLLEMGDLDWNGENNTRFIAACSPRLVLELLHELNHLRMILNESDE